LAPAESPRCSCSGSLARAGDRGRESRRGRVRETRPRGEGRREASRPDRRRDRGRRGHPRYPRGQASDARRPQGGHWRGAATPSARAEAAGLGRHEPSRAVAAVDTRLDDARAGRCSSALSTAGSP
jgi:hypothetical protein